MDSHSVIWYDPLTLNRTKNTDPIGRPLISKLQTFTGIWAIG
jgi:hypothetical protein